MSLSMKKKFPSITSIDVGTDGNTSFLRAARNGQLEKVLEHLESNIDINTSNANGLNALHLASKDGHVEIVEELLKRGAVIDAATKKGNTALHIASLAGQEEVVKLLVNHGASVNVQSQNGFTPLYMAAQENHDNVVKYLLANGANQSLSTEDGFTPLAVAMQQGHDKVVTVLLENDTRGKVRLPALHIAAKKDDVKAAKLLLENEHNPDVTSKSGFTPLHIASHYGNQSIANLLVQKGADVNYAAKHNITPLHVAAKWGKTNMVTVLLEQGANIESKTRDGLTPLHCAARSGHEQVVDMLLEKGAPISSKTKNGLAPLHMAAQGDHVDAARILLYHRAPVDEVTVDYLTALHVAAHCGHVRVAKLLLDRQADANARALNGFTPLHIACKKNRIKVVELLLKHGASIGATTESGLTPLHVASFMGCMNIVIYLLQHDANPDVPTVRGETPLHLAARANQTDIIRILLRNGAQVDARAREQQTPLHIASRLGNVDIVMLLLQHGAKVDNTTKDMYTALHIAAKEGQDEVAAALIDNGASLNATTKKGFTPLHLAAKYGHLKVAKLLLQKEAPVDAQGKNGVTPLHVASHYDHQNVALLLLEKGASPYATAKNGHTPLHIAAKKNQMDIANTLLEYGAKPNAESKAGFTPLHLSAQEGHCDMTDLLIEHKADTNHRARNGLTPLHLCAQEDKVPVAEILVKNGGEVDAATKNGYTPLHIASHYGQINMVRFLLLHGANVKATTSLGYTPLHQAAQQGHTNIVNTLLENSAQPNATTNSGQTPLHIAEKLGYITVIDTLKVVTQPSSPVIGSTISNEEKYRVVAPEAMHETFMSDSEEEGGEDTVLGDQTYRYLTADEMKSLGDDSLPIDVTRDERIDSNKIICNAENMLPPRNIEDNISPEHVQQNYVEYIKKYTPDNVDIDKHPISIGFLVSFLVDARGGAMRGCRHSGVRVIVPSRCAPSPTRITCRYVRPQRTPHPPPLMEGEALASRVLELGPVGAKFLGPVIIEVPHFAALRGKEREIVILRSDNGESWKEHTVDATEEVLNEVLHDSFEAEDLNQMEDVSSGRITRIVTQDFPQYFAVVSRIRQEVHAIGPEGGMVSSTVVPQVQAVFPQGALTKKIKVGLQAQPIDPELTAKLLGHGVAVSPVVTVEPRRRKFHKAITLSMPAPRAHSQGMINQYSGSAPTLRLLCSITGGTTRAQWEDVTGSTPLTFVNDCVSFTTTVSARFWLMDCRNVGDATKMATELYREAIHVPFMAKFVVFAKRVDPLEARLRVFCMTDDKEDKTLEHQEHFTEVAKSRDVEVLEGKPQYIEFAGNLVPITKSGEQLQFSFRAFRENRLPFSVRVKDQHAEAVSRCLFMREPKLPKGEPPQQPICILNIVLPDDIVVDTISLTDTDSLKKIESFDYYRPDPRLADMSNLLGEDWVPLAAQLGLTTSEINVIKSEYPDSVAKQAQSMLRMWLSQSGNKAQANTLESALRRIGREDIIPQCLNVDYPAHGIKEIGKQRLIKKISLEQNLYEKDIMKDSESVESLRRAEEERKKENFDKYSAEEKVVEETSEEDEEEDFNKTVTERRKTIEERLSVDRTVPASSQRVEIVQEISSIKRQSLVENKIAEVEQKAVGEVVDGVKTTITSNELTISPPVEKVVDVDRRDSALLEGVTQRFESSKMITKIESTEDPKSPKVSKTPPPSPADFITKEQAAAIQDWDVSKKSASQEEAPFAQDAEQQGLSTTTERLVASNEETLLDKPLGPPLTGLSVIDDYLVTDLKTVFDQTNAFIQSESQPEPYDALADKYTRKEPINDKKIDDNKNNMNEKKKAKKGFFGSIKTFVERSFESDSESEKSPKKSKKPKKDKKKKTKDDKPVAEPGLPPRKPKLPTPPLAPSDIDSIPFVEASVSDLPPPYKPPDIPSKEKFIPVTDLDADLVEVKEPEEAPKLKEKPVEVKEKEKTPKPVEVKEKEKAPKPVEVKEKEKTPKPVEVKEKEKPLKHIVETKEKEKPKEKQKKTKTKTVVVEEVTKTIEPLVIEAEEFSIIVDPTKKESPKKSKETFTINIDETVDKKEKEILERSPILTEEKIVKPLAALEMQTEAPVRPPRVKDHVYEDIEDPGVSIPQDRVKDITTNLIQNEINFGGWSDVAKTVPGKVDKEEESQKEIVEKQDKEVSKEKDVKAKAADDVEGKKKEEKKGGFFGLFKKRDSKKEEDVVVEKVEEVAKKPLSEAVLKDMADSTSFLLDEVQNYHDVRPAATVPIEVETVETTSAVPTTTAKPEMEEQKVQSEGFFGLFKKPKKEEKQPSEKKSESPDKKQKKDDKKSEKKVAVVLSEEVLKNMLDSKQFLESEVENYHDVKTNPVVPKEEKLSKRVDVAKESAPQRTKEASPKKLVEEKREPSPKKSVEDRRESSPKPGFFGLFKKSKKEEPEVPAINVVLSDEVVKDMQETDQFLIAEIENYHDVKPSTEEVKVEETVEVVKTVEAVESQPGGFFGLFKKSKKEEEAPTAAPQLSEAAIKDMAESNQFLLDEVQNYQDVRPTKEETVVEEQIAESAEPPSSGFFGLFKKTKREDEKIAPEVVTKEVLVIKDTALAAEEKPDKAVIIEDEKIKKVVVDEVRESSPKPSAGFFGLFKKSKKDDEETIPIKPPLSDSVLKDMTDTSQFLSSEVENYHDVKPEKFDPIQEDKITKVVDETVESSPKSSRGLFGIFKKPKKDHEEPLEAKLTISETVLKEMDDTNAFLTEEVDRYHDVKPEKIQSIDREEDIKVVQETVESSPKSSRGLFGIFKKSKKEEEVPESKPVISETALKEMDDTNAFLAQEVDRYHDVKPEKFQSIEQEEAVKVAEEAVESSPKSSRGLFGIFKRPKKDQEVPESKPDISETAVKDMDDTNAFLIEEVDRYHDVKPEKFQSIEQEDAVKVVEESVEASPKSSRGLFGIFKKSKKDQEEVPEPKPDISETAVKDMDDTNAFLIEEVDRYHDVKPERFQSIEEEDAVKVVEESVEASPKSSRGLFGIFKKSKKDQEEPGISEAVVININETNLFLSQEVDNYHDVKPETFDPIQEEKAGKVAEPPVEASPKSSRGLFGMFKKTKKDHEDSIEAKPVISEEALKDIGETDTLLTVEVEDYVGTESTEEEKATKVVEAVESSPKSSRGLFGIFKKSKKDEEESAETKPLSETVVKEMDDTTEFLVSEVENYHDVKLEKPIEEEKTIRAVEESVESSPKSSRGLFGIFKKSKKEEEEPSEPKVISEEVQKVLDDTNQFLTDEVQNYHDAKFVKEEVKIVEEQEIPPKPTSVVFEICKQPPKEEKILEVKAPLSEEVQREMNDTTQFLLDEVENYHDVKPILSDDVTTTKTEIEDLEVKPEVKVGFLSKFKITKKKTSLPEPLLPEEVQKDMHETKSFISTEVDKYEDVKIIVTDKDKKDERTVTFDETKSKMVLEGRLPQPEVAHVVELVKKDTTDLVKETKDEIKETVEFVTKELSEVKPVPEQQETKPSKKDKQGKDKKGFFNIFGKKSKSQDAAADESRGRVEESIEGSPKKQKRRKSSSPFKFFDKMKKSEEDLKELEAEIPTSTKIEAVTKEEIESKDDLLTVEFEDQPTMDLSKEVLGSLDKKMEELKSKYTPEVQKQMNDCRDFLFIEVDNYEDAKPVVVTDIDTGLSIDAGKTVDDVIDKAAKAVELGQGQVEAAKTATVESATKVAADVEESAKKAAKKAERKSGGFFSKLGSLISGSVDDAKSELKEAKKSAEKTVDKTKESAQKTADVAAKSVEDGVKKTKEEMVEKKKKVQTKVDETKEQTEALKDSIVETTTEKIDQLDKAKESALDTTAKKIDDAKVGIMGLKESLFEATAEKVDGLKKDTVDKTQAASEKVMEVRETTSKKIDDVVVGAQIAVDKTKSDAEKVALGLAETADKKVEEAKAQTQQAAKKLDDLKKETVDAVAQKVDDADKAKKDIIQAGTKEIAEVKKDVQATVDKGRETVVDTSARIVDVTTKKLDKVKEDATKKTQDAKTDAHKVVDATAEQLAQTVVTADKTKTDFQHTAEKKIGDLGISTEDFLTQFKTGVEDVKDRAKGKTDDLQKATDKTIEDVQTTAILAADDFTRAKESFKDTAAQKADEVSKTVTQKADDFSKSKDNMFDDFTKIKESAQKTATEKVDDFTQIKHGLEDLAASKVDDLGKAASQKIDDFAKVKEGAKDAAAQKVEELTQAKDKVKDAAAAKVDDFGIKLSQQMEDMAKAKDSVVDTAERKAHDFTETAAQKVDDLAKAKQEAQDAAARKVDELAKAKEDIKLATAAKLDDFAITTSKKIDDLSKAKEAAKDTTKQKIGDAKEEVGQKMDDFTKGAKETKSIASTKADDFTKLISQKVDDVKSVAEQKVDDVAKVASQKKESVEKVTAQKADELSQMKESVESTVAAKLSGLTQEASQKVEDFAKMKDTTAHKVDEVSKTTVHKIDEAKKNIEKTSAEKIDDVAKLKDSGKDLLKEKVDDLNQAKIRAVDDVARTKEKIVGSVSEMGRIFDLTETKDSVKDAGGQGIEQFAKGKESVQTAVAEKVDAAKKTAKEAAAQKVADLKKIQDTALDDFAKAREKTVGSTVTQVEDLSKATSQKGQEVTKSIQDTKQSAIADLAKLKESATRGLSQKVDDVEKAREDALQELFKIGESAKVTSAQITSELSKTTAQEADDFVEAKERAIYDLSKIKASVTDSVAKTKESAKDVAAQKADEFIQVEKSATDDLAKIKEGVADASAQKIDSFTKTKEAVGDLTKAKVKATTEATTQKLEDISKAATQQLEGTKTVTTQKVDDFSKATTEGKEKAKETVDDLGKATADFFSTFKSAASDTAEAKKKETDSKMAELEDELSKLTSSLEQLSEPALTLDKVKSYVTSPTMARRAESQRFSREERPTVREVSSVQREEDSDEEQYTVTEPEEVSEPKRRPLFHIESEEDDSLEMGKWKDRRDSVKSNVLETLGEAKLDNLLSDLEEQLVKDLDRSVAEGKEKTESKVTKAEVELEALKKDSQADVEQIEQKLRDLDKALDSLEQASDPKLEKKLHRVERKFERMASEVMENDVGTSPTEVEARRENEFQKLVSQLSTEEVSDFQKEYSHLWDETTFSKSDDWDSKTPDSQVDVQELPQGEESSFAATGGPPDSILKVEGEESASGAQQIDQTSSQQRSIADQHQLSEEMKQLLKELEKESKQ